MSIVPIIIDKRVLRSQLLAVRQAMSVDEKNHRDAIMVQKVHHLICAYTPKPRIVALFSPIRGEPNMMPLAKKLLDLGLKVVLPIVVDKDAVLQFVEYTEASILSVSTLGILEPSLANSQVLQPDVLVIPCLGFNAKRYRLGYGGGFYDRTLAQFQLIGHSVLTVGVAYQESKCDFVPNKHDVALSEVIAV